MLDLDLDQLYQTLNQRDEKDRAPDYRYQADIDLFTHSLSLGYWLRSTIPSIMRGVKRYAKDQGFPSYAVGFEFEVKHWTGLLTVNVWWGGRRHDQQEGNLYPDPFGRGHAQVPG